LRRNKSAGAPEIRYTVGGSQPRKSAMNKRLRQALELVKDWPDERQEDAARLLLAMQEQAHAKHPLDEEQRRRLDVSLAQIEKGELASDEEVRAVRAKHGL
jgi:hypothetical protein